MKPNRIRFISTNFAMTYANALLFDRKYHFLGEVATRDGSLARVMLTTGGEDQIGAYVSEWQTRGVPVLRMIAGHGANTQGDAFYQERVVVRDHGFMDAMKYWLERHGVAVISVAQPALECWERITRLPLEPREQFSMIVAIRTVENSELQKWQESLQEATSMVEVEEAKLQAAIVQLRQKAAKKLAMTLAKGK